MLFVADETEGLMPGPSGQNPVPSVHPSAAHSVVIFFFLLRATIISFISVSSRTPLAARPIARLRQELCARRKGASAHSRATMISGMSVYAFTASKGPRRLPRDRRRVARITVGSTQHCSFLFSHAQQRTGLVRESAGPSDDGRRRGRRRGRA